MQEQDGSRDWLTSDKKLFKAGIGDISHVDWAPVFLPRQHRCQPDIRVPVVKNEVQSATLGFSSWT